MSVMGAWTKDLLSVIAGKVIAGKVIVIASRDNSVWYKHKNILRECGRCGRLETCTVVSIYLLSLLSL